MAGCSGCPGTAPPDLTAPQPPRPCAARPGEEDHVTASASNLTADSIGARLDRLRWSNSHLGLLLAIGAGWMFDSLEVNLVGNGINPLSEHFHATTSQSSQIHWVWLIGIPVAALVAGQLADRYGRPRPVVAALLWHFVL